MMKGRVPQPLQPMSIVELRQLTARQLEPLLEEEARHWRDALYWDYRPSLDLVKKFLEARSLSGFAALEDSRAAGYTFYVLEDHKGLVGGLYVGERFPQLTVGQQLMHKVVDALRGVPRVARVEAQLIPFGNTLDVLLTQYGFRLYPRQFMLLRLADVRLGAASPRESLQLERWQDRFFEPCARLIQLAYANHVDGEINDQYRSEAGALKFLKNIILLPGCGQFQSEASLVLRTPGSGRLAGVVLTSEVSKGVGHTTQICVLPELQGLGYGRQLMQASVRALRSLGFQSLSLTVTSANASAVALYQDLGFHVIKRFSAGVWEP